MFYNVWLVRVFWGVYHSTVTLMLLESPNTACNVPLKKKVFQWMCYNLSFNFLFLNRFASYICFIATIIMFLTECLFSENCSHIFVSGDDWCLWSRSKIILLCKTEDYIVLLCAWGGVRYQINNLLSLKHGHLVFYVFWMTGCSEVIGRIWFQRELGREFQRQGNRNDPLLWMYWISEEILISIRPLY